MSAQKDNKYKNKDPAKGGLSETLMSWNLGLFGLPEAHSHGFL
jgi:hypothetical protein